MLELTLPEPPSANTIWRTYKGRMIKSKPYRDWLIRAGWEAKAQGVTTFHGHVRVDYIVPHGRKDIDNFIKPLNDLLQGVGVFPDDRMIRKLVVTADGKGKTVHITIRQFEHARDGEVA